MVEGRAAYVAAFAASILAVAVAYGSTFLPGGAPAWAPWSMAVGVAGALASVMAVGATRGGRLGPLGPVFLFVFVVLAGGLGAALLLQDGGSAASGAGELWLGLPPPAAVVVYGVGLLPLVLVPGSYALTFDALTLSDEEWARIRALRDESDAVWPPEGGRTSGSGSASGAPRGRVGSTASGGGADREDAG